MAQIRIYNQETNSYLNIDFSLQQAISDTTTTGDLDCYLLVSTNIPTSTGGVFPRYKVRDLSDVPPGYVAPAADFNELCQWYYEYITVESQITLSSSSSSSEGYSSSSSSSSEGNSSSSSSSSEGNSSSSSSSSEEYSSSSSSESEISSSSSVSEISSSSSVSEISSSSSVSEISSSSSISEISSSSSESEGNISSSSTQP